MKIFLILLLTIFAAAAYCQMKVIIDENRFLDEELNTILEINYKVPYKGLTFYRNENGFEAQLKVNFMVSSKEEEVYTQEFTSQVILDDQEKTVSDGYFLDKITLTLTKSDFEIALDFTDVNSGTIFKWEYFFTILARDAMLSDLEFSHEVMGDTTDYLQKFHRWDHLFLINPSHIFDIRTDKIMFLYYEIGNFFKSSDDHSDLTEVIAIFRNEELIRKDESPIKENKDLINRIKQLEISNLDPGYYTLEMTIKDNISGYQEVKKDFFSIKHTIDPAVRIFPDIEDDFKLVNYFLPSSQTKVWKDLSENGKKNFLKRFWDLNDPDPVTEENEFLSIIKDRVTYATANFSHFEDGWNTDMGRIFIRNGLPDDVQKLKTGFYTKYATKDYEIWKYRSSDIKTYVFIDLLTSGNYKLIYNDNDDREMTLPDWKNYLDSDFDETLLD